MLIHARVAHVDTTHTDATPRHALLACVKAHVLGAAGTSPDVAFVKSAPAAATQEPARCAFGFLRRLTNQLQSQDRTGYFLSLSASRARVLSLPSSPPPRAASWCGVREKPQPGAVLSSIRSHLPRIDRLPRPSTSMNRSWPVQGDIRCPFDTVEPRAQKTHHHPM